MTGEPEIARVDPIGRELPGSIIEDIVMPG